jgi:hypothetical protein
VVVPPEPAASTQTSSQTPSSGPLPDTLSDGLILYYEFLTDAGSKATDLSVRANHGTIHGGRWVADGPNDGGISFNQPGNRNQVAATGQGLISLGTSVSDFPLDDFTISVSFLARNPGTLIGSGANELWPREWHLTPQGFVWTSVAGVASGAKGQVVNTVAFPGVLGRRCNVTVTRSARTITAYVDGLRAAADYAFPSGPLPLYARGLMVGNMQVDLGRWQRWEAFDGTIDCVCVWNRELPSAEVERLYRHLAQDRLQAPAVGAVQVEVPAPPVPSP